MSAHKFASGSLVAERSSKKGRHFRGTGNGRSFGRWWKTVVHRAARRAGVPASAVEIDAAPLRAEAQAAHRRLQSASAQCVGDNIMISYRWAQDAQRVHSD